MRLPSNWHRFTEAPLAYIKLAALSCCATIPRRSKQPLIDDFSFYRASISRDLHFFGSKIVSDWVLDNYFLNDLDKSEESKDFLKVAVATTFVFLQYRIWRCKFRLTSLMKQQVVSNTICLTTKAVTLIPPLKNKGKKTKICVRLALEGFIIYALARRYAPRIDVYTVVPIANNTINRLWELYKLY